MACAESVICCPHKPSGKLVFRSGMQTKAVSDKVARLQGVENTSIKIAYIRWEKCTLSVPKSKALISLSGKWQNMLPLSNLCKVLLVPCLLCTMSKEAEGQELPLWLQCSIFRCLLECRRHKFSVTHFLSLNRDHFASCDALSQAPQRRRGLLLRKLCL